MLRLKDSERLPGKSSCSFIIPPQLTTSTIGGLRITVDSDLGLTLHVRARRRYLRDLAKIIHSPLEQADIHGRNFLPISTPHTASHTTLFASFIIEESCDREVHFTDSTLQTPLWVFLIAMIEMLSDFSEIKQAAVFLGDDGSD